MDFPVFKYNQNFTCEEVAIFSGKKTQENINFKKAELNY